MPIEHIIEGLRHVSSSVQDSVSELAGVTGAEELAALQTGGEEVLESSSNSVSLAEKKARDLAHSQHDYVLGIIRKTLRNSLMNKLQIMLPGFVVSLLTPAPILKALRPAFAAFGTHLGIEATETMHQLLHDRHLRHSVIKHKLGEIPDPKVVLEEPVPNRLTVEEIIHNAKQADRLTTLEITAAVVGSIDNLPATEQATIMSIYGLGMTVGVHGLTIALIKMEDWGQRLESWNPNTSFNKLLAKSTIPSRLGLILIEASPKIFHYMPWAGAAAKYVTSGRVIAHAITPLEDAAENAAQLVETLPYFGDGLTGIATRMAVWGVVGIVAGGGAYLGNQALVKPLKRSLNESPLIQNWARTSRTLLIQAALVLNPDPLINPCKRPGMELRRRYEPINEPPP